MLWPNDVLTFLSNGGRPNYHVAVLLAPVELLSGDPVSVGYWTGWEDVTLALGGVSRTLIGTKGALFAPNPVYAPGTEIRTQDVGINGLSNQGVDLIQAYDLRLKPAELWQLCFTQGAEFKGARRLFKGVIDQTNLQIGTKGTGSRLTLTLASSARSGTRTLASKKSNESYKRRGGDTAMEYASLMNVDADWWGPRG